MITDPSAAYDAAREMLANAAGFRFEIGFESTPTRAYEATGAVSRGRAAHLSGAQAGQPPKEWKVFRSGPSSYRAHWRMAADQPWLAQRGVGKNADMPLLLEAGIWILNAHDTIARPRLGSHLSSEWLAAEVDGQECQRFTAHLDEGAFYWVSFYAASGQLARVTRSGHGGGWMVTLTQAGEPVAISDPDA